MSLNENQAGIRITIFNNGYQEKENKTTMFCGKINFNLEFYTQMNYNSDVRVKITIISDVKEIIMYLLTLSSEII